MIKRGEIYPTEGMKFGVSKIHGPWGMLKCLGEKPGSVVSLFVKNPEAIKDSDAFKIDEIISVSPRQRLFKGKWVQIVNVVVVAEPVEFRSDSRGRVSTPEDDIDAFMRL